LYPNFLVRKPVRPGYQPISTDSGSHTYGDKFIMPYKERLYPWVMVRLLPKMQRLTVGQFRTRSHADGHLEILRRLVPSGKFAVIFNPDLLESQQADTCYRTSDRVIFKEPLPGHGEGVRLFFLGINNFGCKIDRTLTPEKRSPVSPPT
jgi:hypothetical protein